MKYGKYISLMLGGTATEMMQALREELEIYFNYADMDRKIAAEPYRRQTTDEFRVPEYFFTEKFFAKLSLMPTLDIEVRDSRRKIRRECYGYRDPISKERVYLKMDGDSVVQFRDSPAGFIIGKRHLLPRLEVMHKPRTWSKVNRLMTRVLREQGIIVSAKLVREHVQRNSKRYNFANRMVLKRKKYLRCAVANRARALAYNRRKREEAIS